MVKKKRRQIRVFRDNTLLWSNVLIAGSFFQRLVGLLNRGELSSSEGLLFYKAPSIHTFGMKFSIDVLFLDAFRCVTAVHHRVKPNRVLPYRKSRFTLELLAGQAEEKGIKERDQLRWEEGQVLLEYVLIISVFMIALIVIFPLFTETISRYIQSIWDFVVDL
jgi:hypothetical protein